MAVRYNPKIVTDGLILSLDPANKISYPGSGSTINNLVGLKDACTVDGPEFSSSNLGTLNYVQGNRDNVTFPHSICSNLHNGNFTISVWFRPEVIPGVSDTSAEYGDTLFGLYPDRYIMVVFGDCLAGVRVSLRWYLNSTWTSAVPTTSGQITTNNWFNYCVTYNSSSGFVGYLNGVSVGTLSTTGSFGGGGGGQDGKLACLEDSTNSNRVNRFFDGDISVVKVYNTDLSSAEVLQNYNALKGRFGL